MCCKIWVPLSTFVTTGTFFVIRLRSSAAFEITKNSTDFFPFPSKSPKVESTTNPFMHSFLRCPPSYLTAESEPFSSDRVRPPLHPSDTITIYAVISVLPSVLPHCILWYGFRLILFSPCDHLCSAPKPHRVTSPLHPPPPLTTHAVTCAPIELLAAAYVLAHSSTPERVFVFGSEYLV